MNLKKIFLVTFLTSLGISAAVGISILLVGKFGLIQENILLTTLAFNFYNLVGLATSAIYKKGKKYFLFATACLIVYLIAFVYTTISIWGNNDFDLAIIERLFVFKITAFSLAQISLLLLLRLDRFFVKITFLGAVVSVIIVTFMLARFILNDFEFKQDFSYRILGVFAILDT